MDLRAEDVVTRDRELDFLLSLYTSKSEISQSAQIPDRMHTTFSRSASINGDSKPTRHVLCAGVVDESFFFYYYLGTR